LSDRATAQGGIERRPRVGCSHDFGFDSRNSLYEQTHEIGEDLSRINWRIGSKPFSIESGKHLSSGSVIRLTAKKKVFNQLPFRRLSPD
jgi:hypothetical protein